MEKLAFRADDRVYKILSAYAQSHKTTMANTIKVAVNEWIDRNGITGVNRSICVGCVRHKEHGDDACSLCPCRYGGQA